MHEVRAPWSGICKPLGAPGPWYTVAYISLGSIASLQCVSCLFIPLKQLFAAVVRAGCSIAFATRRGKHWQSDVEADHPRVEVFLYSIAFL